MPLFHDLSSYYYGGGSSSYSYLTGPYSSHSSIVASNYSRPTSSYTKTSNRSNLPRGYKPHLATINETQAIGLSRLNSPKIRLRSSPKMKYQRPISINTADIDVSTNKYRKIDYPKKEYTIAKSPESSYKEEPDGAFMPKMDNKRSTIKRERTVVRFHTDRNPDKYESKNDEENEEEKKRHETIKVFDEEIKVVKPKWRENFEPDELKLPNTRVKEEKPISERLKEKFMIKEKEEEDEIARMDEERKKRREENLMMFANNDIPIQRRPTKKMPKQTFHQICRSVSSEKIDEGITSPGPITRKYSRKKSGIEDLKNIRRNSAEVNREEVEALELLLQAEYLDSKMTQSQQEADVLSVEEDTENVNRRKKFAKTFSNENLVLEESEQNSEELSKSDESEIKRRKKFVKKKSNEKLTEEDIKKDITTKPLQRKKVKKRTSTDLSKAIDAITPLVSNEADNHRQLKLETSVEVESIKTNLKVIIDDIKVEEISTPLVSSPTRKIKYDVIIDEIISTELAKNTIRATEPTTDENMIKSKEQVETKEEIKTTPILEIKIPDKTLKKDLKEIKKETELLMIVDETKTLNLLPKNEAPPEIKPILPKKLMESEKVPVLLKTDPIKPKTELLMIVDKSKDIIPKNKMLPETKEIPKQPVEIKTDKPMKIESKTIPPQIKEDTKPEPKIAEPKIAAKPELSSFEKQRKVLLAKKQSLGKQASVEESNDDDFWGQIGKRETINFKNRKKYIDARKEQMLKAISWSEDAEDDEAPEESVLPKLTSTAVEIKNGTAASKVPELLRKVVKPIEEQVKMVEKKQLSFQTEPKKTQQKLKVELKQQIVAEKQVQQVILLQAVQRAELSLDIKPEILTLKQIEKTEKAPLVPKVTSKVQVKQESIESTIPVVKTAEKQLGATPKSSPKITKNVVRKLKLEDRQNSEEYLPSPVEKNKMILQKSTSSEKASSPTEKKKTEIPKPLVLLKKDNIAEKVKTEIETSQNDNVLENESSKTKSQKELPDKEPKLKIGEKAKVENPRTSHKDKISESSSQKTKSQTLVLKMEEKKLEGVGKDKSEFSRTSQKDTIESNSQKVQTKTDTQKELQNKTIQQVKSELEIPSTSQKGKFLKTLSENSETNSQKTKSQNEKQKSDSQKELQEKKQQDKRSTFEKKFIVIPRQFQTQNSIDNDVTPLYQPPSENDPPRKPRKPKVKPKLEPIIYKTLEVQTYTAVITNVQTDPQKAALDFIIKEKYDSILKPNKDIRIPSEESYRKQQEENMKEQGIEPQKEDFIPLQSNIILDVPAKAKPRPVWFDECPVVIMATPRDLRKRVQMHRAAPKPPSDSSSSEESSDSDSSDSEESDNNVVEDRNNNANKRKSTSSNDSGFDSSAPGSPANCRIAVKGWFLFSFI